MINILFKNILRFIFLVLLQVIILNKIQFSGFINPYLYVIFILMLPFDTPAWILITSAFFLGLCMDTFSNTMGMHAAASVLMAFCRPFLLAYIAPREGYEFENKPAIAYMGFNWYLSYAGILVLIHHICLFYIEVFSMNEFFSTLSRVVLSVCFTLLLILIIQYLFYSNKR